MSLSQKVRQRRRGGFPFSWFPIKWLSPSREKGEGERESCNCCQSLLSTTLKAAAFSQLRSERSLGCVASPPGLWRIWWVPHTHTPTPPTPFLFTSHCQQRQHNFWMQRNQKAKSLRHSETETWVIGKIILNMPAMIWKVFKWWKFPHSEEKCCTQISQHKSLSRNFRCTDFDVSVFTPDDLSATLADVYSSKPPHFFTKQPTWQTISSVYEHSKHALQPLSRPHPVIPRTVMLTLESCLKCIFLYACMVFVWKYIFG